MEIRKFIEDASWYSAAKVDGYSISASRVGSDLLPLYLAAKFPKDESKIIGLNYIGSAFHLGMEHKLMAADNESRYSTERFASKVLPNGWTVTGTSDVIDNVEGNVHDYKTTSASGYKKKKKEARDTNSSISLQMSTLKWLNDLSGSAFAEVFIRDFKPWHQDHPASAYQQLPIVTLSSQELVDYLVAKTDKLQEHLDDNKAPEECENVMWMVYEGNRIKMKCEYYCDYKKSCPAYKANTNHLAAAKFKIGRW